MLWASQKVIKVSDRLSSSGPFSIPRSLKFGDNDASLEVEASLSIDPSIQKIWPGGVRTQSKELALQHNDAPRTSAGFDRLCNRVSREIDH
jgi:hypothetical protein